MSLSILCNPHTLYTSLAGRYCGNCHAVQGLTPLVDNPDRPCRLSIQYFTYCKDTVKRRDSRVPYRSCIWLCDPMHPDVTHVELEKMWTNGGFLAWFSRACEPLLPAQCVCLYATAYRPTTAMPTVSAGLPGGLLCSFGHGAGSYSLCRGPQKRCHGGHDDFMESRNGP